MILYCEYENENEYEYEYGMIWAGCDIVGGEKRQEGEQRERGGRREYE